jgi:outer membrane protein OmpA-like peptidoglycan-associated protein/opacity protein-like surface antigen
MVIKKYALMAFFLFVAAGGSFAQLAGVLDYSDSSKVRAKKMAQQNEWANGLPGSPFPAKPRDAWQLGVYGGMGFIRGDVNTAYGWVSGLSLRKALGYTVSVRGSIGYGEIKGWNYEKVTPIRNLPANVRSIYQAQGLRDYIHIYKSNVVTPSVDFIFSLNNIMFHRKSSKFNFYGLLGYSAFVYETKLEALDNNGRPYTYTGAPLFNPRRDIKKWLKDNIDADYETGALVRPRRSGQGQVQWRHSFNFGAGVEHRLGDIVSISAETRYTIVNDDFLDGWVWSTNNARTSENDGFFQTTVSLNFNLGLKSRKKYLQQAGKDELARGGDLGQFPGKRVAPLWMHNPLGQPYGELSNPTRMNMPKGWLEDSDNDGVVDQFDLEPNTPAGVPVDTRGRSRDTDGDGVPDHLDKELITPTACFPVNADGVGKCPDPKCCTDRPGGHVKSDCNIGSLPSVQFASGRASLSSSANAILDAAAEQIKANPSCKICVVGYGGSSKREQQLSWDRVNAVINYLVETKGIGRERFVFKYGAAGDANTVDLQDCTGEDGANMVPAPYPQYRSTKK